MTIKAGDKLPDATFMTSSAEGPKPISSDELFKGKTVALLAVPGAFTPTCSAKHLPGFKEHAAELKAKGVDTIACVSVNDVFVMKAWGADQGVGDDIIMLADGNGDFTKAIGLEMDGSKFGMGVRS
ncbi:MAG: redoxin family protein, partial [Pseudomonadota bacterium]